MCDKETTCPLVHVLEDKVKQLDSFDKSESFKLLKKLHKYEVMNEVLQNCLNCENHEENKLYCNLHKKDLSVENAEWGCDDWRNL